MFTVNGEKYRGIKKTLLVYSQSSSWEILLNFEMAQKRKKAWIPLTAFWHGYHTNKNALFVAWQLKLQGVVLVKKKLGEGKHQSDIVWQSLWIKGLVSTNLNYIYGPVRYYASSMAKGINLNPQRSYLLIKTQTCTW